MSSKRSSPPNYGPLADAYKETGAAKLKFSRDMFNFYKQFSENQEAAQRPQRELGYKAMSALDAGLSGDSFRGGPVNLPPPPQNFQLPTWNRGMGGQPHPGQFHTVPQQRQTNLWPQQVNVPQIAPTAPAAPTMGVQPPAPWYQNHSSPVVRGEVGGLLGNGLVQMGRKQAWEDTYDTPYTGQKYAP